MIKSHNLIILSLLSLLNAYKMTQVCVAAVMDSFLLVCRVSRSNTSWITWIVLDNWWVIVTGLIWSTLCTFYFARQCSHILFQSYIPSKQDILFARKATKGIVEHDFVIKKIPFKMVDVGGQRSQRQKWFQCFDGITSILFMASSSEYDQVRAHTQKKNTLSA